MVVCLTAKLGEGERGRRGEEKERSGGRKKMLQKEKITNVIFTRWEISRRVNKCKKRRTKI